MADGFCAVATQFAMSTYALRQYVRSIRPIVAKDAFRSLLTSIEVAVAMESTQTDNGDSQVLEQMRELKGVLEDVVNAPDLSAMDKLERFLSSREYSPDATETVALLDEIVALGLPELSELTESLKSLQVSFRHADLLLQSALIAALMYFEALVSGVLTAFYCLRPQALSADTKILSFNELKGFRSLEEATDYVVGERVSGQMRETIGEWRSFFQKQLKVDMADIVDWDCLCEVYQRRNLIVHNRGIVNKTYLAKVAPSLASRLSPPPTLGTPLPVTGVYLDEAVESITVLGLGLVDQCWRRLVPADGLERDKVLLDVMTQVLFEPDWSLLSRVCRLVLRRPTHSEPNRLLSQVNYWLAEKRLGHWEQIRKEVVRFDRVACHPAYSIGVYSLLEDPDSFFAHLPVAVSAGVRRDHLTKWPIFDEMRCDPRFSQAVDQLFPTST